jgi:hypothetical protein
MTWDVVVTFTDKEIASSLRFTLQDGLAPIEALALAGLEFRHRHPEASPLSILLVRRDVSPSRIITPTPNLSHLKE